MKNIIVVFCASLLALAACGPSSQNNEPHTWRTTNDVNLAERILHNGDVTCAPGTTCSPSVGMISGFMVKDGTYRLYQCTAFLVSDNIIATNSHCVDDALSAGSSCDGYIVVNFPNLPGYEKASAECATVITRSDHLDENDPSTLAKVDEAFLQLKSPPSGHRPALPLDSTSGFPDKMAVQIFKVDPVQIPVHSQEDQGAIGTMKAVQCEVKQKSVVFPAFQNALNEIVGFYNSSSSDESCKIIHGNSGSPVLDSTGHVRGIVQEVESFLHKEMYFATNLACVLTPVDNGFRVLPPECSMDLSAEKNLLPSLNLHGEPETRRQLQVQVTRAMGEWGEKIYPFFKWSFVRLNVATYFERVIGRNVFIYIPFPKCIKPDVDGLKKYRHFLFFYSDVSDELQFPVYQVTDESASKDLSHLEFNVVPVNTFYNARISFSPGEIHYDHHTKVSLKVQGVMGENTVIESETGFCQ